MCQQMEKQGDWVCQRLLLWEREVFLVCLSTLVNLTQTQELLPGFFETRTKSALQVEEEAEMRRALFAGQALVFVPEEEVCYLLSPAGPQVDRAVTTTENQSVIQSAQDAFTENLETNLTLVRKKLQTSQLVYRSMEFGTAERRRMGMLYVEGLATPELVEEVWAHCETNRERSVPNTQTLLKLLKQRWWDTIPTVLSLELPSETVRMLKQGRVVLFLDQYPYALVTPGSIFDGVTMHEDLNYPAVLSYFFRMLRVIGAIIAIVAPSLYVALVSVNPEVLRIQLALSIAQSREGVPYPAFVEILLMLIFLELVFEASVRLPKTIGPTITMVGGIILGQAVVQAELVSNLLIIVLSAMTIANFALVGYQNALVLRMLKYVLLFFGTIFGMLGVLFGIAWFVAYVAGITVFGIPYLKLWKTREVDHG